MQFLEKDFLEQIYAEIDSNGDVIIEDIAFSPQRILQDDDEAFKSAFAAWCEIKKQERIQKAEQILSLYDNADRFEALRAAYRRGAVIPFVGAGLSMPSGYPGWTEYLYSLREETTVPEADLAALISRGEYEEAAQLLFDALPYDSFNEHLENKFDAEKPLAGCVRFLPYCFPSSVVTTNFDSVLKRCYDDAEKPFNEVLLGVEATEFARLMGKGDNILLKFHGKANTARNRILTKQEYDRHYEGNNTLENCMDAICQKTLLFMGCSLTADRTIKCLRKFVSEKGAQSATRHYAFIAVNDDHDARIARRNELVEANIFPIWYPADEDHDECLMALLEKLVEEKA